MTEREWLECASPRSLIVNLSHKLCHPRLVRPSKRKLWLLACALSRYVLGDQMTPEISEAFISIESSSDALTYGAELRLASQSPAMRLPERIRYWLTENSGFVPVMSAFHSLRSLTEELGCEMARLNEGQVPSRLVRDVFGNPYRPRLFHPSWLTSNVVAVARTVYEETSFDLLAILADALEEAGCTNADLLAHCRALGPHVRGCWAVDLLLGKK